MEWRESHTGNDETRIGARKVPVRIFVYCVARNENWCARISVHTQQCVQKGTIDYLDVKSIAPGEVRANAINNAVGTCDIAVVLVSADLWASEEARLVVDRLIARSMGDGMLLLPVVVGACDYRTSSLSAIQPLNRPDEPLESFDDAAREKVFCDLIARVRASAAGRAKCPLPSAPERSKPPPLSEVANGVRAGRSRKLMIVSNMTLILFLMLLSSLASPVSYPVQPTCALCPDSGVESQLSEPKSSNVGKGTRGELTIPVVAKVPPKRGVKQSPRETTSQEGHRVSIHIESVIPLSHLLLLGPNGNARRVAGEFSLICLGDKVCRIVLRSIPYRDCYVDIPASVKEITVHPHLIADPDFQRPIKYLNATANKRMKSCEPPLK